MKNWYMFAAELSKLWVSIKKKKLGHLVENSETLKIEMGYFGAFRHILVSEV